MITEMIGTLAGMLCAVSFFPQVIKVIRTKQTKDLSLLTFLALSIGVFCWFIYGLMLGKAAIIISNGIILFMALAILLMKLKYK